VIVVLLAGLLFRNLFYLFLKTPRTGSQKKESMIPSLFVTPKQAIAAKKDSVHTIVAKDTGNGAKLFNGDEKTVTVKTRC